MPKMGNKKRKKVIKFVESLVISLVCTFIVEKFIPGFSNFFSSLPSFLTIIPSRIYLIILFTVVFWLILSKRKTWRDLNSNLFGWGRGQKPKNVFASYLMESFGVKWKVFHGNDSQISLIDEGYYHVDGPFCPNCDYELESKEVPTKLGFSSYPHWYCPDCNKNFKRPKKVLYDEHNVVLKRFKKIKKID